PGMKISYEANVGDSPDDNYFIYANPETGQMEWLGYTVTYGKDGPSDSVSYIRYNDWIAVNGLTLPNSLQWYNSENNSPSKPVGDRVAFKNISVSEEKIDTAKFAKPEGAQLGVK
ncbi:MAG: hypothetical protein HRT68_14620, partial [Flavobacteriaceae bacterium]|nr:hypothetical protein [Flavobacteriaceae bacterium]